MQLQTEKKALTVQQLTIKIHALMTSSKLYEQSLTSMSLMKSGILLLVQSR